MGSRAERKARRIVKVNDYKERCDDLESQNREYESMLSNLIPCCPTPAISLEQLQENFQLHQKRFFQHLIERNEAITKNAKLVEALEEAYKSLNHWQREACVGKAVYVIGLRDKEKHDKLLKKIRQSLPSAEVDMCEIEGKMWDAMQDEAEGKEDNSGYVEQHDKVKMMAEVEQEVCEWEKTPCGDFKTSCKNRTNQPIKNRDECEWCGKKIKEKVRKVCTCGWCSESEGKEEECSCGAQHGLIDGSYKCTKDCYSQR